MTPRFSIVIPLYNEEAVLPLLMHRIEGLLERIGEPTEVILVDDGSTDVTGIVLEAKARQDERFRFIGLSRNFGQQIGITAGLDHARGEAVIIMDGDLQDPPEVVPQMIAKWKEGFEVVYAKRRSRAHDTFMKRTMAAFFYNVWNKLSDVKIPENVGDFRLIDRKVLAVFQKMPERERFVRGMFAWLGFRQTSIEFDRPARPAGATQYPFIKQLKLALNSMVGFSDVPLRLAIWAGMGISILAAMFGTYAILQKIFASQVLPGWTSVAVIISFLCGMNMLMTGIIGVYVGRIHREVQRRPLYVVTRSAGIEPSAMLDHASDAEPRGVFVNAQ
jgi:glycosyltransferase involved in cell wall biosynthesis